MQALVYCSRPVISLTAGAGNLVIKPPFNKRGLYRNLYGEFKAFEVITRQDNYK